MKRLIAIILMVFIISTTAYGSSFLPSGFDTEQSGVYFRPYVFDADNCVEFYIEGLNLHYKMTPNERISYIKLVIKTTNMATVRTVSATEVGKEITGVLDLSDIQNSTSTFDHIVEITLVDKNNNSTTLTNRLYKDSGSMTFQESANTYANRNYESFYKDLPEETIEYYKSDYIGDESDESTAIYREKSAEITKGLESDYEKALAIYEWVCENVYYDYDAYNGIGEYNGQNPLVALTEKRAVCGGYTTLTAMLLQAAGIPARYVFGDADGELHAWNYAYIDGRWIYMDTTWGSQNTYENGVYKKGELSYLNFGMTCQMLSYSRKCAMQSGSVVIDDVIYKEMIYGDEPCYYVADCINEVKRDIRIRDVVNGKKVRIIEEYAFDSNQVRSVIIPETVLRLEYYAFNNMTDFTLYFEGNETMPLVNSFYKCSNFVIYANTDSHIMNNKNSAWNVKAYKNLNWYIDKTDSSKYGDYVSVTVKHGALKKQPLLICAVYDNNDVLKEVKTVQTTSDTEFYSFSFKGGYNYNYYAKFFLVSDYVGLYPYTEPERRRFCNIYESGVTIETYHCYDNNHDESFTYNAKASDCRNIDITFNMSTHTEPGKDFVILYDADGREVKRYSGYELSGKTVCVPGNAFTVRLLSDEKNRNYYGFKITKIVESRG